MARLLWRGYSYRVVDVKEEGPPLERVAVERLQGVDALGAENWQPVHDERFRPSPSPF